MTVQEEEEDLEGEGSISGVCEDSAEGNLSTHQEGGVAEEEVGVAETEDGNRPSKKARIEGLYRPPTHDELQALKETQNLFKSNLMKLQVRERERERVVS